MAATSLWTTITSTARRRLVAGCVAGSLVVAVLAVALWPEPDRGSDPRARQYLEFTACMLTDARGLGGMEAAAVWTGMQDASLATRAKVQYLPVLGENGDVDAGSYLAGLLERRCEVVIGVGAAQATAVRQEASRYPRVRFAVVVGGGSASPSPSGAAAAPAAPASSNPLVTAISWSDSKTVSISIAKLVRDAVDRRD